MNILGITMDSNSSACAMKDGVVVAATSEERYNKIKNYIGYPKEAVEYCMEMLDRKVDKVLLPSPQLDPMMVLTHWTKRDVQERMREQHEYWHPKIYEGKADLNYAEVFPESVDLDQYPGKDFWSSIDLSAPLDERIRKFRKLRKKMVAEHLGISEDIIKFKNHHLCHSYYAYYASPLRDKPVLSFTADGFGDLYNATLRSFDEKGKSKILMQTDKALLGRLYRFTTLNLKMKPLEDEYKVMGLAPYATEYHWRKPYEIFKELLEVDGINFKIKSMPRDFFFEYQKKLESCRFDAIAGGLQKYLEEMIVQWVSNSIDETGIEDVVFSGGVSMNVKAMMEVIKIPRLKSLHVPPSGADESLCIGACYHEASLSRKNQDIDPIVNGYLGKDYTKKQIEDFITREKLSHKYEVRKGAKSSDIAEMIEDGAVIALFLGRMEFGARALGARSIVADPRDLSTVKRINYKIKNRDFWMPFAPVVLEERFEDYFYNDKGTISPFMTIGFETREEGRTNLKAALHAADLTGRPQLIRRKDNQMYYDIIKSFEERTGTGALLNTSFNLHGLPIVMTPEDAIYVFENSGLDAVLLQDTLVVKRKTNE